MQKKYEVLLKELTPDYVDEVAELFARMILNVGVIWNSSDPYFQHIERGMKQTQKKFQQENSSATYTNFVPIFLVNGKLMAACIIEELFTAMNHNPSTNVHMLDSINNVNEMKIVQLLKKQEIRPGDCLYSIYGTAELNLSQELRQNYWRQLVNYCYAHHFKYLIFRYSELTAMQIMVKIGAEDFGRRHYEVNGKKYQMLTAKIDLAKAVQMCDRQLADEAKKQYLELSKL